MEFSFSLEGTSALIFFIVCIALILITIISKWKIFSKASRPGWASIIPIYSDIVLFEIADINILKVILLFIPIANIIMTFSAYIKLSKKFGKGTGLGVLMVLLPIIGLPILAFGKSEYENGSNASEDTSSILDVNLSGVPNTGEEPDFKYGYEKENTVVMNPVDTNNIENNVEANNTNSVENNIELNPMNSMENMATLNNDINSSLDNSNIDNINVLQTEGVLNASPDNISANPAEDTEVQNIASEENSVLEVGNDSPIEPLENSALDAQINQEVSNEQIPETIQNDIPQQSIIEDSNDFQTEQIVDTPVDNPVNQTLTNETNNSSDDEDFTEVN